MGEGANGGGGKGVFGPYLIGAGGQAGSKSKAQLWEGRNAYGEGFFNSNGLGGT